jgi:signal transduction histidine kinase
MVSIAAHALNNCITVMQCSIDLFRLTNSNRIDDEVNKVFEAVHRASSTMSQIITGLHSQVAFSRDTGIIMQNVDIITVLKRASYHYNEKARAKKIRVIEHYTKESLYVQTDWFAFAVIIDNIFSNVIKYSPTRKCSIYYSC